MKSDCTSAILPRMSLDLNLMKGSGADYQKLHLSKFDSDLVPKVKNIHG